MSPGRRISHYLGDPLTINGPTEKAMKETETWHELHNWLFSRNS
jgi:hypothetical protein